MASLNKQRRRAQRAKIKAKQTRLQRAAAANTFGLSDADFDFQPVCLDEMFCECCSAPLSLEQRELSFAMTTMIDHDEVYFV